MGTIQQWINRCIATLKAPKRPSTAGGIAESLACDYLCKHGLKPVCKNYRTKVGEIDLIMMDNKCWVFVEVKFRSRGDWASAAESVTREKQRKIINAAKQYMQQRKMYNHVDCRFDVVAIDECLSEAKINWIPHAFY